MKLTVSVTQKHIDAGKTVNCRLCPVALALCEQYPMGRKHPGWMVGVSTAHFPGGPERSWKRFALPPSAQTFILAFDREQPVQPFDFEMEATL